MPDYTDKELPEREFLFGILGTLYNKELSDVVSNAYQHRTMHYKKGENETIEVTNGMMELLKVSPITKVKSS